ncbi:MAG: NAD(P)/FAD-dependent oxidoreductase, partial [Candidatus Bathyarchaeia archaeon]
AEAHFDENVLLNKIRAAYVYAPDESKRVEIFREIEEIGSGFIIDKKRFLKALLEESAKRGSKFKLGTTVVRCERINLEEAVKVTLSPIGEVSAKLIIGCDGFNSTIRKTISPPERIELISCIQYAMKGCRLGDESVMRFYFGREVAPLGYLWVFPKGNGLANVGVGVRKGPAKDYLDKFIKKHPEMFSSAKIMEVGGAPVTVSGQIKNIVQDNIMLCGEAAGQVIPLTGAGIHTSLVSGKIAGEVAVEALRQNDLSKTSLNRYVERYNLAYGERIAKSRKALTVLEKLSDDDLNKLAEVLTGADVLDLANGTNVERVAKKLLAHPILAARVAVALLS